MSESTKATVKLACDTTLEAEGKNATIECASFSRIAISDHADRTDTTESLRDGNHGSFLRDARRSTSSCLIIPVEGEQFSRDALPSNFGFLLTYAVLAFLACFYFQCVCAIICDQSYRMNKISPLRDIFHDIIFPHGPMPWAPVKFVNIISAIFAVLTFVRFGIFNYSRESMMMLLRFLYISAFCYIIRGIAIVVTTMPSARDYCEPVVALSLVDVMRNSFLMATGRLAECSDMIISGHTLMTTHLLMCWVFYERKSAAFTGLMWLFALLIYVLLNAAYFHYTVDIFLGFFMATSVWWLYHMLIEVEANKLAAKEGLFPEVKFTFSNRLVPSAFVAALEGLNGLVPRSVPAYILRDSFERDHRNFDEV